MDTAFLGAAVGDSRPEVLQTSASVRRMRDQNRLLRSERDKVDSELGSLNAREREWAKRDMLKGPVVTYRARPLDVQQSDKRGVAWDKDGDEASPADGEQPPPFPPLPDYEVKARQKLGGDVSALYGKDLTGLVPMRAPDTKAPAGEGAGGDGEGAGSGVDAAAALAADEGEGPTEEEEKAKQKYFVATIIVAVVEKEGLKDADGRSSIVPTPQALEDLRTVSPDNLLSLELLWAPEKGGDWLKKEEVLEGLSIVRDKGYFSGQRLDLYGNQALW